MNSYGAHTDFRQAGDWTERNRKCSYQNNTCEVTDKHVWCTCLSKQVQAKWLADQGVIRLSKFPPAAHQLLETL